MEHLLLKAATTVTDEGVFEAVISTASIDSDKDIVEPAAMVKALRKWADLGKMLPLAWQHSTAAEDVIGHIDPTSVKAIGDEVIARGWVDQSTDRGQHVWRLVKSGTLGFSFGYMVTDATKRKGGGLHIKALDVFEITATIVPSNRDTRVVGWKSAEDLREESEQIARDVAESALPEITPKEPAPETSLSKALKTTDPAEATAAEFADALDDVNVNGEHLYVRAITPDESAGVKDGHVKAIWTTAYINNLPDSAFLHIEAGGTKDSEGKTTPRSLRHFPVKDADGNVDMPHLRNALSRIPQSSLSQEVKDRCTAKARRMMDAQKSAQKSVDVTDKPPAAISVDPLRKRSEELALEISSDGMSLRKPPTKVKAQPPDLVDADELKRQSRDLMFEVLSYSTE